MSVIIRLQNLPWSANALDIRAFFRGLSIPDGGVHIVGGEMGDAFIAFSTDEDARQAMALDRGKINEVQVRLLLSSRTEMQKVIEQARQNSLAMQMQRSSNAAAQSLNKSAAQNQIQEQKLPQPPVITSNTLTNILSAQSKQQYPVGSLLTDNSASQEQLRIINEKSKMEIKDPRLAANMKISEKIIDPRLKSRSRDPYRSNSRSSSRERDRDRRRSSSRERSTRNRRGRRSRSRDRSRERSRDRSRERNRERDRKSNRERSRYSRSRSRESSVDRFGRQRPTDPREKDPRKRDIRENDIKRDNNTGKMKGDTKQTKSIEEEVAMILDNDEDEENEVEQPPIPPPNSQKMKNQLNLNNQMFPNLLQGYTTITQNLDQLQKQNPQVTTSAQTSVPSANTNTTLNFQNPFGYQSQLQNPFTTLLSTQPPMQQLNMTDKLTNTSSAESKIDTNNSQINHFGNLLSNSGAAANPYSQITNPFMAGNINFPNFNATQMSLQNPFSMMANLNQMAVRNNFEANASLMQAAASQYQNQEKNAASTSMQNLMTPANFSAIMANNNIAPNKNKDLENINQVNSPVYFTNLSQIPPVSQTTASTNNSVKQNENRSDPRFEKRSRWDPPAPASASGKGADVDSRQAFAEKSQTFDMKFKGNDSDLDRGSQLSGKNRVTRFADKDDSNKKEQDVIVSPRNDEPIFGMHYGPNTKSTSFNEKSRINRDNKFDEDNYNNRDRSKNDRGRERERDRDYDRERDRDRDHEIRGKCVKLSNLDPAVLYSDIRKFFNGLLVANNGIKMINDQDGNRTGVAYVRFVKYENKPKALSRNNSYIKSNKIKVENVTDEEFEDQVDSYRPPKPIDDNRDRNERIFNENDHENDNYNKFDSKYREKKDRNDASNNNRIDKLNKNVEENVKDDNEAIIKILDLPLFTTELDIMKMFSSYTILDILLDKDPKNRRQMFCLIKFHRYSEAKSAYENKSLHILGHRNVNVKWSSAAQFTKMKEEMTPIQDEKISDGEQVNENNQEQFDITGCNQNIDADLEQNNNRTNEVSQVEQDSGPRFGTFLEKYEESNASNDPAANIPSLLSLQPIKMPIDDDGTNDSGPRNRNNDFSITSASGPSFNPNSPSFSINPGMRSLDFKRFILLRNCVYKLKQLDYANFFRTINLEPQRIEILFNKGRPTGECVIEFDSQLDAERALTKNNQQFCGRSCRVELINANQAAEKIGDDSIRMNPSSFLPLSTNLFGGPNLFSSNDNMPSGNNNTKKSQNPFNRNDNDINLLGFNRNLDSFDRNNRFDNRGGGERRRDDDRDGANRKGFSARDDHRTNFDNRQGPTRFDKNQNMDIDADINENKSNDKFDVRRGENDSNGVNDKMMMNENINIISNTSVDQFGKPDCVIALSNVPYKADTNDILDLFRDFDVSPQNIIRRYNDNGTPTGDARIALSTPEEAKRAIEQVRSRKIFNRTIYLSLL